MIATNDNETKFDRPGLGRERTWSMPDSSLDISVDDLPGAPDVPRTIVDLAELFDALRYQLRRVEAQVVSAGRELIHVAVSRPDSAPRAPSADRALHLISASISATETALRVLDAREERLRRSR